MNNLLIRSMNENDADAVSVLISLLGYPLSADEAATRINILGKSDVQEAYVAMIDQNLVGLIAVSYDTMLHLDKPMARITTLIVDPNVRRMKIGQVLVEKAMDFAHKKGCDGIEVASNRKRDDALNFYMKNGFLLTSNGFYKKFN